MRISLNCNLLDYLADPKLPCPVSEGNERKLPNLNHCCWWWWYKKSKPYPLTKTKDSLYLEFFASSCKQKFNWESKLSIAWDMQKMSQKKALGPTWTMVPHRLGPALMPSACIMRGLTPEAHPNLKGQTRRSKRTGKKTSGLSHTLICNFCLNNIDKSY